jgi:hypothetical protein
MFDQFQDDMDYELNAPYDYIREAYAGMEEDPATLAAEAEADYEEWAAEQAAFIGPRLPAPVYEDGIPF